MGMLSAVAAAQTPSSVDLFFEARTYTPTFYRGHSQVSSESEVRVVALADFPGMNPNNLTYTWKKDNFNLPGSSGIGKNTLTYQAATVGGNTITVKVSNGNGAEITKSLTIPVITPKAVIYPLSPLSGANYGAALGSSLALTEKEVMLLAEPYFVSLGDFTRGNVSFDWQVNNKPARGSSEGGRVITFAAPAGETGEVTVSLLTKNSNKILQKVVNKFNITYGRSNFNF